MRGAWLALAGAAGCATVTPPPRPDSAAARAQILVLAQDHLADDAGDAWTDAEEALAAAERATGTPRANDAAYVALRKAARARLAALHARERQALEQARAEVRRLGDDDARREAFFTDLARRREADAAALVLATRARRRALDGAGASDPDSAVVPSAGGIVFRTAAEALFLPGTSLLRDGAEPRLSALASALRRPPACEVRVQVLDDVDGRRTGAARLAARRSARVHDALLAHGVPPDAFVPPLRHPPPGTQVDVIVEERPPAAR